LEKKEVIVLPLVGQDGFDSYHEMKRLGCWYFRKQEKRIRIGSIDRYLNNERVAFYEVDATSRNS
jgi:hypothetical protein